MFENDQASRKETAMTVLTHIVKTYVAARERSAVTPVTKGNAHEVMAGHFQAEALSDTLAALTQDARWAVIAAQHREKVVRFQENLDATLVLQALGDV